MTEWGAPMAASFMLLAGLVLFVLVPLAVLGTVAVLVARSGRRGAASGTEVPLHDAPAAYRRAVAHARSTAWASWLLLVGASVTVGMVAATIPGGFVPEAFGAPTAAAGLVFLAACAVGELTWPTPQGPVRRAPLQVRTAAIIAPRGLRRLVWAWAGLLVVTLVATGVTAATGGTELTLRFGTQATSTASPYPGWRYGVPLMAAALLVVAACEAVLRLVARRPAVADTAPDDDLRLRRVSARRVLAAVQLVLAITAATVLAVTANATRAAASAGWGSTAVLSTQPPSVDVVAAVLGSAAGLLAVAALLTGVVVTVVALARAAAEAGRPVTQPPAPAGGAEPAGAPS